MRYRSFPFKYHIYNFDFILDQFGSQGYYLLKKWIDMNYRIIKAHCKLHFLKHCKTKKVFPQHVSHIIKMSLNILNHKAIRKFEGLVFNFKLELINIEIFDLHKYIYFLNKELSFLSRSLHRLLPSFVWDSIVKHHTYSFNNFKHRLFVSHYKKFMGLLTKTRKESLKSHQLYQLHISIYKEQISH